MSDPSSTFFHLCIILSFILLAAATVLALIRMLIGPYLPDRVVALDNISMIAVSVIALFSIISGHPLYLDIIIALSLISFLGMVAFAQFIEWQPRHESRGQQKGDF